ncbi:MAG: AsmA family protein, partial [Emcibacteraceae bacterium]|nr:AsmA family protein [Emcibacteraceae bacterium]
MKKIGLGAGIILILLIGSALVVPSFVDWNKYKTEIETTASNLSERKVTINGDLSLSILPSPSFSAEDVSVANVEGGKATHFVTLKSVDVNVAFFPLLSSDIQVKKFILVEPNIALEIDENGKGNWEFGSTADQNQSSNATEMSFEQFQIENGQVSYQDLKNGTQELIRGISANVTMDSLNGPFEIDGDVRYKNLPVNADITVGTIREGRKIPLNVKANLMNNDVMITFIGGVSLDGDSPSGDGKVSVVAGDVGDLATVMALLDTTSEVTPTKYNHPLSLETSIVYGGDAVNISAFEFEMGESRGSGNLKATFDELTRFEGAMSINSFNLDSFLNTAENETGIENSNATNYSILETLEGTFNFKLGALQYNDKIASQLEVDLTATNGGLNLSNMRVNMPGGSDLTLNGTFSAPKNKPEFNGDVKLGSGNLRAFLEWLKIDVTAVPTGRLTRLSYSSAIRADESLIQVYGIDSALDTFQFKGGVSYALQDRPSFGIEAEINNLNVDNYIAETEEETNYKELLSIFADFDVNYQLTLNAISTGGIKVKKVVLNGELYEGSLNAKSIDIDDYAGFDFNGSLIANDLGANPKFETSFNTTTASLVPLQRAYRFKTDFDISDVGAVAVNARMNGNFNTATLDVKSTFGSTKMDVKGNVSSKEGTDFPEFGRMDIALNGSNPSLLNLIDQFDLPMTRASAADDRSISLETKLKGTMEQVTVDGKVGIAGGEISLIGDTNFTTENELSSYNLAVNLSGANMREFIRGLGTDFSPANPELGSIDLNMQMAGNATDVMLRDISGNLGPTTLSGSGELNGLGIDPTTGGKSNFNFTLAMDNIPVKEFMAPEPEVASEDDWGNWNDEPMELAILNDYEGQVNITAKNIQYDDYDFENPAFEAVLKDGVININNFTGKLFGGNVNVAGTFSSAGDLNMDMGLTGATLAEATSTFAGVSPVSGTFDMTQNFTGKGVSQNALISSLSGTGEVVATPGAISGIDIPSLSEQLNGLQNKSGLFGLLAATLSGGETPYQGGKSIVTMKDGFIELSPFDIQMLGADSAINMGINLADWKMNLAGDMSLKDHPDAPSIGLSVAGDLHNPEINYNTKALEGFIGEKIAASLLQNMVEGNGGLGAIFGGIPGQEAIAPATDIPAQGTEEPPVQEFNEPVIEDVSPEPEPEKKQETVEE